MPRCARGSPPRPPRAAAVGENWMAGGNLFIRRTELPSQDALPMQQQRRAVLLDDEYLRLKVLTCMLPPL